MTDPHSELRKWVKRFSTKNRIARAVRNLLEDYDKALVQLRDCQREYIALGHDFIAKESEHARRA